MWQNLYQHWMFLAGSSKSRSTPWRRTSRDLWVKTAQWPPPGRTRTTAISADSPGMIRQSEILNQVQSPSRKSSQKEKMGLETRLPVTQVARSSQEVRLETGAAQAWAEMLPQIHGQWVQDWGWLGQLGPFSALRTLAAPQRKMYTEMGGEWSTIWERSSENPDFYKQEWSKC